MNQLGEGLGVVDERLDGDADLVEDVAFGARVLAAGAGLQVAQIGRQDRLQDRQQLVAARRVDGVRGAHHGQRDRVQHVDAVPRNQFQLQRPVGPNKIQRKRMGTREKPSKILENQVQLEGLRH